MRVRYTFRAVRSVLSELQKPFIAELSRPSPAGTLASNALFLEQLLKVLTGIRGRVLGHSIFMSVEHHGADAYDLRKFCKLDFRFAPKLVTSSSKAIKGFLMRCRREPLAIMQPLCA